MPYQHRRALAAFRCGTAPIRLETGRYVNLAVDGRTCYHCEDRVEDEQHVISECPIYTDLRTALYSHCTRVSDTFNNLNDREKICFILSSNLCVRQANPT